MHQAEALEDQAERLDVAVTGPLADVERRPGVLQAGVQLPGTQLAERHQRQHEPVLGPDRRLTIAVVGRQQPSGRRHPARDDGKPERHGGIPPETQRHARCRPPISACEIGGVCLLPGGSRGVELPGPGGGVAEQLHVLDVQRGDSRGLRQEGMGLAPDAPGRGGPSGLQRTPASQPSRE